MCAAITGHPPVRISDHLYRVHGSDVNWYLYKKGSDVVVIDTGYPQDRERLVQSLISIDAHPQSVRAILITHAHADHVGGARYLSELSGAPVVAWASEVDDARNGPKFQVGPVAVARRAWRPRVLFWGLRAKRALGRGMPTAAAVSFREAAAQVPAELQVMPSPGHTASHASILVPDDGVLLAGDALCMAHPTTAARGPGLLPAWLNEDNALAGQSLALLATLPVDTIGPGHGGVFRGNLWAELERRAGRTGLSERMGSSGRTGWSGRGNQAASQR